MGAPASSAGTMASAFEPTSTRISSRPTWTTTPSTTSPRRSRPTLDASSSNSFISERSSVGMSKGGGSREEDSDSSMSNPTRRRGGKFGLQYTPALNRAPVLQRLRQSHLIGVFEVATHGQPTRNAAHLHVNRP